jgi:hypothetical protein
MDPWARGLVRASIRIARREPTRLQSDRLWHQPGFRTPPGESHIIDFVILGPTWLGITMFASLPILFGLLIVPLQAKLEPIFTKARSGFATALLLVAGLAPLAVGGPVALILVVFIAGGILLAHSASVRDVWSTTTVDIYGRAILGATAIFGLGFFAWGALEILV